MSICPICQTEYIENQDRVCVTCGFDLTPYPLSLNSLPEVYLEKERTKLVWGRELWQQLLRKSNLSQAEYDNLLQTQKDLQSRFDKINVEKQNLLNQNANLQAEKQLLSKELQQTNVEKERQAQVSRDAQTKAERERQLYEQSEQELQSKSEKLQHLIAEQYSLDDTWILGVDFGSTAIRASLFNNNTGRVYSLYFDDIEDMSCKLIWFEDHSLEDPMNKDIRILTKNAHSSGLEKGEVTLVHFKQFLKLGLPYRGVSAWQPIVQWSDGHQVSLRWLIAALKNLLKQIQVRANHPQLPDVGLILLKLSGVVFGYPSNWSDTYILNVREAILKSGLVSQSEQVMAVEQALAPVLSLIHDQDQRISEEITLFIDVGAVTTSLCLTKGIDAKERDRSKLHIRSLDYAGISINQDIIVKLFYPYWQLITNPNRHLCKFDHLNLPEIGATDTQERIILQQYLLSSSIGQQMLELADRVKITFGKG